MLSAAALLAGCATPAADEPAPPPTAAAAAAPVAAAPAPVVDAPAALPAVAPLARVADDGTVARFTGAATDLPPGTAALLDRLAQDKRALWDIKGYSDRATVKTAREVALARALAVRKELVARGVPAQNLRVKYSTEEAREAVTVLMHTEAAAALTPAPAFAPAALGTPPAAKAQAKAPHAKDKAKPKPKPKPKAATSSKAHAHGQAPQKKKVEKKKAAEPAKAH